MDIERVRQLIRRGGVRFPRLGRNISSGQVVMAPNPRVFGDPGTANIAMENGYDNFFTAEGIDMERADLEPRATTATAFLGYAQNLMNPEAAQRWGKAMDFFKSKVIAGHSAIMTILSWDISDSAVENIMESSLRVGARIEINDGLENFRRLLPSTGLKPEVAELVDEAIEIAGFADLGSVTVPVKDISIADVMSDKKWKEIGAARILDWVMTASLARRRVNLNMIFPEDYPLAESYPQLAMSHVHDASFAMNNAFNLKVSSIEKIGKLPGLAIAQRGMVRFARRFAEIRGMFKVQLFNPDSGSFGDFSAVVNKYLNGERDEAIMVLHKLGLNDIAPTVSSYRRSRELVMMNNNPEFFGLFGDAVKDIVEEGRLSEAFYIPTQDDLVGILDEEKGIEPVAEPAAYVAMATQVSSIFQRKSVPEYDFDVAKVDWGNLVPPQKATIKFQPRPHKFSIELGWRNEVGESLYVNLSFDTRGNKFDWSFLEGSEDPSMAAMKGSSFVLAQNMLRIMDADIRTQLEEKRRVELAKRAPTSTKSVKRERNEDEVYGLRKVVKREARQTKLTVVQATTLEAPTEIKKEISIPEKEDLEPMLAALGSIDQGIVRVALDDFNEKGIGKFTRKKSRDEDGEPLYTLAVGCTTPKGVRVLVKESSSSAGSRTFEIIDIRYRKDIYRKARI